MLPILTYGSEIWGYENKNLALAFTKEPLWLNITPRYE
jgi:hypothetical protein